MSELYEYSYVQVRGPGGSTSAERRYRGRCSCGRQTHMTYSTPGIAMNAIRFVHNANTEQEQHDRRSAAAIA
jgi:hypothetical protein